MVKKITSVGDNLTFEDDVQAVKRELDEVVKSSFSDHNTRHQEGGADEVIPALHAARHEEGGADEVTPALHASRHEDGGADEIDITGLVGLQFGKNILQNASFQDTDGDDLPDFWDLNDTPTLLIAADTLFPGRKGNQVTITATAGTTEGIEITGGANNWLKVLPSTKYTFSMDYKVTVGDLADITIKSFNGAVEGTTHISTLLNATVATTGTFSFITDADADNLEIVFRANAATDVIIVSHPKLEQGSIATPYIHDYSLALNEDGDLRIFDAVNDGNPQIRIGSADANEGHIQAVYDGGAQTLDYLLISTDSGGEGDIVFMPKGNFGIGTTTPGSKFTLHGTTNAGANLFEAIQSGTGRVLNLVRTAPAGARPVVELGNSSGTGGVQAVLRIRQADTDEIAFGVGTSTTVTEFNAVIMADGSMGLGGITAPLAKLHIDQADGSGALPVLTLDQADESDGFINFIGSDRGVINQGDNSAVSVRVELAGVIYRLALYADA